MTDPDQPDRRRGDFGNKLRRKVLRSSSRTEGDVRRVEIDRDILMASMAIVLLFVGVLLAFTLYQQHSINTQQKKLAVQQKEISASQRTLKMLEKRDRIGAWQTAYRFCTRINIDRATIQWLAGEQLSSIGSLENRELLGKLAKRYRKRLEKKGGAPILDCTPNLSGGPAALQPVSDQREFVRRWVQGDLTQAEIGICKIRIAVSLSDPGACPKP